MRSSSKHERPRGMGTLRQRGQTWHLQWIDPTTGAIRSKSLKTAIQSEAEALAAEHMRSVASSKNLAQYSLRSAILNEIDRCETDVSASRAERVGYALRNFLVFAGERDIRTIDFGLVEAYQRHRINPPPAAPGAQPVKPASRATVNAEMTALRRLLAENGIHIPKPKPKRAHTVEVRGFKREELVRLFHTLDDLAPSDAATAKKSLDAGECEHRATLRALYALLLTTGARPAEAIPSWRSHCAHEALRKDEVDFAGRTVLIRSAKRRSGDERRPRRLPLSDDVADLLAAQIARNPGSPYVFPPMSNANRDFDLALKRAGIDKYTYTRDGRIVTKLMLHSFRHTYGELAVEGGQEAFALQLAMGHARPTTTARYTAGATIASVIDATFVALKKAPSIAPTASPVSQPDPTAAEAD